MSFSSIYIVHGLTVPVMAGNGILASPGGAHAYDVRVFPF